MKELVRILLENLLSYLPRFISILKSPRQTIEYLCGNEEEELRSSFSFFILTLSICDILQSPLLAKKQDFVRIAGSLLAIRIAAFFSFAGAILWPFSVCRGQGTHQQTLCASLYISSPAYLLLAIFHLVGTGILASVDPGRAEAWRVGEIDTAGILDILQAKAPLASATFLAIMTLRFLWLLF